VCASAPPAATVRPCRRHFGLKRQWLSIGLTPYTSEYRHALAALIHCSSSFPGIECSEYSATSMVDDQYALYVWREPAPLCSSWNASTSVKMFWSRLFLIPVLIMTASSHANRYGREVIDRRSPHPYPAWLLAVIISHITHLAIPIQGAEQSRMTCQWHLLYTIPSRESRSSTGAFVFPY